MKIRVTKNLIVFRNIYYDFSINRDFIYLIYDNEKYIDWIGMITE